VMCAPWVSGHEIGNDVGGIAYQLYVHRMMVFTVAIHILGGRWWTDCYMCPINGT
ncbi:hypothetical protein NDU88_000833, partial [Pleurodeles waltl]